MNLSASFSLPTPYFSDLAPNLSDVSSACFQNLLSLDPAFDPELGASLAPASAPVSDQQRLQQQAAQLELQTENRRLTMQEAMMDGKGTEEAYPRHVAAYEKWWGEDQQKRCQEDPTWISIDAHPITAAKVAAFLEYESKRPQVCFSCDFDDPLTNLYSGIVMAMKSLAPPLDHLLFGRASVHSSTTARCTCMRTYIRMILMLGLLSVMMCGLQRMRKLRDQTNRKGDSRPKS
jgi:hypothetical protein